jgi:hypothetical protein
MPLYFLLLDADAFHGRIRPALAASWRGHTFEPCRPLCASLRPAADAFARRYHLGADEPLLAEVARGLPFDRDLWRHLAGEILWYSAADIPEFETAPDTLCCLLAPERDRARAPGREHFAPVEQIHYGARDLAFGGGFYRPDRAGYNDRPDVARLAAYLDALDPGRWAPEALAPLEGVPEADRAEELEYAREWFPSLRDLYRGARSGRQVVVCELL